LSKISKLFRFFHEFSRNFSTMTNRISVTANFPFPELTTFADATTPPTFTSLRILQRELNANATSVHSKDGGGAHGHLTLTVPPARYMAIAGALNAFPPPIAPPRVVVYPPGSTAAAIAEAVRAHVEDVRIFQTYHDVDTALVRAIISATPKAYIELLDDPELSYTNAHHIWHHDNS
jgi:hypothetical protein